MSLTTINDVDFDAIRPSNLKQKVSEIVDGSVTPRLDVFHMLNTCVAQARRAIKRFGRDFNVEYRLGELATIRFQGPRQIGHTTAAIRLAAEHHGLVVCQCNRTTKYAREMAVSLGLLAKVTMVDAHSLAPAKLLAIHGARVPLLVVDGYTYLTAESKGYVDAFSRTLAAQDPDFVLVLLG